MTVYIRVGFAPADNNIIYTKNKMNVEYEFLSCWAPHSCLN